MRFPVFIILPFLLMASTVSGQYYYQDIIVSKWTAEQFQRLKQNKIRTITVKSFEADETPIENFRLTQKVLASSNQLVTNSNSDFTGNSEMVTSYNDKGELVENYDSTNTVIVKTNYTYNTYGNLDKVSSISYDDGQMYVASEIHQFEYNQQQQPVAMWRIKTPGDSLKVVFIPADNGKPGEEQWWQNGRKTESWYYYYDEQNRLTDIVRFNKRAGQLLPDYLFEYDDQGKLSKQTTVLAGTSDYRVWYYAYDERGLKTGELILDKQQKPLGSTSYEYQ